MAAHKLFGKYYYTQAIQTLARKGYTKADVRKLFDRLGCGDVAENTIKTQFTDYKNEKYAKQDVPFTPDEWNQMEQARNGEAWEVKANHNPASVEELLRLKETAKSFGGVERMKGLCDVLVKLQHG